MSSNEFSENENAIQDGSMDSEHGLKNNSGPFQTSTTNRNDSTIIPIRDAGSSEQDSRSAVLQERAAAAMDRAENTRIQLSNIGSSSSRSAEYSVIDLGPAVSAELGSSETEDDKKDYLQGPKSTRNTWTPATPSFDIPVGYRLPASEESTRGHGSSNSLASIGRYSGNYQSIGTETLSTEADIGARPITMYSLAFMLAFFFGPLALIPLIFMKKNRNQKSYLYGCITAFVIDVVLYISLYMYEISVMNTGY